MSIKTKFIDVTGLIVGRLTVIRRINGDYKHNANVLWECLCSCSEETKISIPYRRLVAANATKSCGCLVKEAISRRNHNNSRVSEGDQFGRLTTIKWEKERKRWLCKCSCSPEKFVRYRSSTLVSGNTQSCGCLKRDTIIAKFTKHGHNPQGPCTPEYRALRSLIQRCTNPKDKAYHYYGGSGISVSPEWRGPEGFPKFLKEVGLKLEPKNKYSLDRINVYGSYEPGNVRWATFKEQSYNQKRSIALRKIELLESLSGLTIDQLIEKYKTLA